ncbi:hypothetical protein D5S19_11050 [Amycolatopsis panacis]|uniref:Uncharacterized protein n=1 Tax=Amycolatopsis panacis TaxID=2340917 RepID=A0A419I601_9PSEU|nr:hypothetical protein D5S19_11050 [Amycolatopsis panacis]
MVYVDMVFARMDAEEPSGWRYEDRSDPGTVSARSELESGRLEWYGEIFDLRWLDGDQEVAVRGQVFDEV